MSIVGSVPQMEAEQVEKMMNNNMQVYLYFQIYLIPFKGGSRGTAHAAVSLRWSVS